ncbi:Oidioi.mRNA.OKI2018_I69.PAR.g8790.t1.cds [Oikopleura dioica]|uniref:Oidioi.mRNA.OKI2018_I69.PAR.g8790.t1.cds n=1 Tax=Oikopleura dioica TaxID=34765 RepID=A0ABN7RHK6_OIKDI|nr:Oidioi.mRNA.OKI2018_I69.PAR.g8790.t1.cds [Oikopleura dioica]
MTEGFLNLPEHTGRKSGMQDFTNKLKVIKKSLIKTKTTDFTKENETTEELDMENWSMKSLDETQKLCCSDRYDEKLAKYVKNLTESNAFAAIINIVIAVNILFMFLQVTWKKDVINMTFKVKPEKATLGTTESILIDWFDSDIFDFIKWLEEIDTIVFLTAYLVEFLLKFYAELFRYFISPSNFVDFFILLVSFIQIAYSPEDESTMGSDLGQFRFLKILRALRALRTLKTLWMFGGAQVIIVSIFKSMGRTFKNIGVILLLAIWIFAILMYSTIFISTSHKEPLYDEWGCFTACFANLFIMTTADGWYGLADRAEKSSSSVAKSPGTQTVIVRFVVGMALMLSHFIIFNLFIAINIAQVDEANKEYMESVNLEREEQLETKKTKIMQRQYDDVKKLRDQQDAKGCSFDELIENFKQGLKHDDYTVTDGIVTDIEWIENHRQILDQLDTSTYKLQQLIFEYSNILIVAQNESLKEKALNVFKKRMKAA